MSHTSKIGPFGDAFWSRFSRLYWEQEPLHMKRLPAPLLGIDSEHLFQLLLRYSDHCRKTQTSVGLKFYIEGESQDTTEVLQFLPRKNDRSLENYHSRMSKLFPDYCLVCDELIQVSLEKWDLLGSFMQGLYQHVGIPNRYSEVGLYMGNYRRTPFGVHADGCGVLSIPVVGTKKFRLWDSLFVEKNPNLKESFHYTAYKKHSTLFSVKPGELCYWPASYWHIAESDGAFSATWSIGMWVDQPYLDLLMQLIKPVLLQKLKADSNARVIKAKRAKRSDGFVEALPELFTRSLRQLRNLPEAELQDTFLKFWLEFSSKSGFKNTPLPHASLRLFPRDRVRGKPENPILWAKLAKGGLCLAANGVRLEVASTSQVVQLIQQVNSGEAFQIKAWLNTGSSGKALFEILQAFYRAHALVKVD